MFVHSDTPDWYGDWKSMLHVGRESFWVIFAAIGICFGPLEIEIDQSGWYRGFCWMSMTIIIIRIMAGKDRSRHCVLVPDRLHLVRTPDRLMIDRSEREDTS